MIYQGVTVVVGPFQVTILGSLSLFSDQHSKRPRLEIPARRKKAGPWTFDEKSAFVEYIALYYAEDHKIWPAFSASNPFWEEGAKFVTKKLGTAQRTRKTQ